MIPGEISHFGRFVQIDANGPPHRRFDLVVLAEGFAVDELPGFVDAVRRVRAELYATAPFGTLRRLVNFSRVDRVGPGDLAARFSLEDDRLLSVDEDRAVAVVEALGAKPDAVLVVVNSPRYAGSGAGCVAAVTMHEQAPRLAVHELGHTAFDLADEYGGDGPAASGEGEPARVNVSRVGDPALVKWADLAGADETVGCYPGGDRTSYGMFRPSLRCRMRSVHEPYCPVCRREITRQLVFFAQGRSPR